MASFKYQFIFDLKHWLFGIAWDNYAGENALYLSICLGPVSLHYDKTGKGFSWS